jgi:hypothetical protein
MQEENRPTQIRALHDGAPDILKRFKYAGTIVYRSVGLFVNR